MDGVNVLKEYIENRISVFQFVIDNWSEEQAVCHFKKYEDNVSHDTFAVLDSRENLAKNKVEMYRHMLNEVKRIEKLVENIGE